MRLQSMRTLASLFVMCLMVGPFAATAQISGQIKGEVIDENGAVIPGARITAVNSTTKDEISVRTGFDGKFLLKRVHSGLYNVRISSKGFKVYQIEDVLVKKGKTTVLDFVMEVGNEAQILSYQDLQEGGGPKRKPRKGEFLIGQWTLEGIHYPPWDDAPPMEEITGEVKIEWALEGTALEQHWHIQGLRGETGKVDAIALLILRSIGVSHKTGKQLGDIFKARLVLVTRYNYILNLEGVWEDNVLIFKDSSGSPNKVVANKVTLEAAPEGRVSIIHLIEIDGTDFLLFKGMLTRK